MFTFLIDFWQQNGLSGAVKFAFIAYNFHCLPSSKSKQCDSSVKHLCAKHKN